MKELEDKIAKMRKGLENPNITGAVRESLKAALKKAEQELADKTRGQAAVERLQENIERAKPTFAGKSGDDVLAEMRGKKAPSDIKRFSWANYPLSKKFMPKHQQRVVSDMGEERESILGDVEAMLAKIPWSQENNDDPIVWAHYFYAQSDWFVLEYHADREDSDYDRFFGFTILNGDSQMAELGYMPVVEFANSNRVELDFYWKPKPLSEAKANADPEMWGDEKQKKEEFNMGRVPEDKFNREIKVGDYVAITTKGFNDIGIVKAIEGGRANVVLFDQGVAMTPEKNEIILGNPPVFGIGDWVMYKGEKLLLKSNARLSDIEGTVPIYKYIAVNPDKWDDPDYVVEKYLSPYKEGKDQMQNMKELQEKDENGIVELYFPKTSKWGNLRSYKEYFWDSGYRIEKGRIIKELVLDNIAWEQISQDLLTSREDWNDENGEPIGGSESDDARLSDKTWEQIVADKNLKQIFIDTAVMNVVRVLNRDTGETFYVNTEGYNYARYVGFDKAPERSKKEEPEPQPEPQREQEQSVVTPAVLPSDCAVTRNLKQNGIEISFKKQPSDAKIAEVKAKGFRWSKFQKLWYVRYTDALHKWALDFCHGTENSDNPATIGLPDTKERLITLAAVTKGGKVPQNLLKSEIAAGKLEFAKYKQFNSMTDSTDYVSSDKLEWQPATMDSNDFDIQDLKRGNVNDHWTNSIRLEDDGKISYGNLYFRYKNTVPGYDYSPKEEQQKIADQKRIETQALQAAAAKVVDLTAEKYWVPFNRKPVKGDFKIDTPLKVEDLLGKGEIDAVAEYDGYKIVGKLKVENKVTMTMMVVFGGAKKEIRSDVFDFTAEPGTATPSYIASYIPFRQKENGDQSDFPGWKSKSFPTSVWESIIFAVREAVYEREKMNEKGKTERGRKIHEGKMNGALSRVNAYKKVFLDYEAQNPGALRKVTGQSADEWNEMLAYWRKELGYAPLKVDAQKEPTQPKAEGVLDIQDLKNTVCKNIEVKVYKFLNGRNRDKFGVRRYDLDGKDVLSITVFDTIEAAEAHYAKYIADCAEKTEQRTTRILGKKRSITLPNGEKHEAQYAVVELDSILASHDEETFADTPGYPKNAAGNNLNDRNYATDKAAQQLVEDYAQNLDPDLVLSLSSTPEGTPIITESGIVVSGNNRTMSMKLARKRYPERWKHYQSELKNELPTFFIYDEVAIASMKAPVLVRIDYDFGDLTTTNMAKYNASSMKAKSPVDKAVELSTTLREQALCETRIPDILNEFDTLSEFYASVSATQRMVKALQQCSVFNEQDVAAYVDKGMLTEDGKTLLETVLAALILQPNTLRTANRDGVRALRQAVVNALPALLANKSLPSERTLVPLINAAIDQQAAFVASGLSYCDFIMQGNLFGESETDPRVFALNRLMVSGQKRFRDAITKYSDNQKGQQGTSMFADQSVSPQEAFEAFIFKSLSAADQECIVNWNKRRTDAPTMPAPKVETEKPADDLTVLKTRLKLLEKRLPTLEGEQKTIIQTRIKLLRKKTGQ